MIGRLIVGFGFCHSLIRVPIIFFNGLFEGQFATGLIDYNAGVNRKTSFFVWACYKMYAKSV